MRSLPTIDGANYLLSLMSNSEPPLPKYHFAICSVDPGISSSGYDLAEPTDSTYTRAEFENIDGHWLMGDGVMSTTVDIAFGMADQDWDGIRYWAICDSYEGGRVLWVGEFSMPVTIPAGDQAILPAGTVSISLDMFGWNI